LCNLLLGDIVVNKISNGINTSHIIKLKIEANNFNKQENKLPIVFIITVSLNLIVGIV